MNRKILIVLGHPYMESFNRALADSYEQGAKSSGAQVRRINLGELNFDPVLRKGYAEIQALEDDLKKIQEDLKWAEHIVWVFPTWWYSFPALLKGLFDRVLLPNFAYKFRGPFKWDKFLKGRSSRLIVTMDMPPALYSLLFMSPGIKAVKSTMKFCGITPVKISKIGSVKLSSEQKRKAWLKKIRDLGAGLK